MAQRNEIVDAPLRSRSNQQGRQLVLPQGAPTAAANTFVEQYYTTEDGFKLLRHWRGQFYVWTGTHYASTADERLEQRLYAFLDGCLARRSDGSVVPYQPTKNKVAEALHALRRSALMIPEDAEPPCRLTDGYPCERNIIVCRNGILDFATRELRPHDARLFAVNAIDLDYDAQARKPTEFFAFLDSLELDDETEDALCEMFGYLLSMDTRQQKIFLIKGPKRGGKGTLVGLLESLLGARNVTYQTLDGLMNEFGRWPLIDRSLCVFADARLGNRGNIHRLVETLLSISGGDPQTINRKYGTFWQGRLPIRFLMTTNTLPALKDSSGTIASRFILMILTKSFYGKEDTALADRLRGELPGILNWALAGLDRLRERGRFVQPRRSRQAIKLLEHLASPVRAFIDGRCIIGPNERVEVDGLHRAYKRWCEDEGDKPAARNMFGKYLRDVVDDVRIVKKDGERVYAGIGLRDDDADEPREGFKWRRRKQ